MGRTIPIWYFDITDDVDGWFCTSSPTQLAGAVEPTEPEPDKSPALPPDHDEAESVPEDDPPAHTPPMPLPSNLATWNPIYSAKNRLRVLTP